MIINFGKGAKFRLGDAMYVAMHDIKVDGSKPLQQVIDELTADESVRIIVG